MQIIGSVFIICIRLKISCLSLWLLIFFSNVLWVMKYCWIAKYCKQIKNLESVVKKNGLASLDRISPIVFQNLQPSRNFFCICIKIWIQATIFRHLYFCPNLHTYNISIWKILGLPLFIFGEKTAKIWFSISAEVQSLILKNKNKVTVALRTGSCTNDYSEL